MSRGLGGLQCNIMRMLTWADEQGYASLRFADIRAVCLAENGRDPGDKLHPTFERSLKRALKGLVDREEVLIVGGAGGPGDPRRYATAESFATAWNNGKKPRSKARTKQIIAEMRDVAAKMMAR